MSIQTRCLLRVYLLILSKCESSELCIMFSIITQEDDYPALAEGKQLSIQLDCHFME